MLDHPTQPAQYVSRGAVDHNGNLFFGDVGTKPVGIFKVHLPAGPEDGRTPTCPFGCGAEVDS